jgi:predicted amidohydrolase
VQTALPPTAEEFLRSARTHVERLAMHDAEIVVFPATPSRFRRDYPHDETVAGVQRIAADTGVMIAFTLSEGDDASGKRAMHLVGPKGIVLTAHQAHKPDGERFATMPLADELSTIVNTPVGRIGLIVAADGFVPEVARSLMLRGAEIILWSCDQAGAPMLPFIRARADENRVWVAAAAAPTATGATAVVDPTGRVAAVALAERELSVSATVNRTLSHLKEMAPGTHVVRGRQPASYGAITAQASTAAVV